MCDEAGRDRLALLAAALFLAACSGNESPRAAPMSGWGEVGPDTVAGTVRQVGNLPFVRTLVDGGEDRVFVTGELEPEISLLMGVEARVTGVFTEGDQPGRSIRATSYEILSIDGELPAVGLLDRDAEGYYLTLFDGSPLRLGVLPAELQGAAGARVWVLTGAEGQVTGYGILREAAE